jgi:hypothetical protein
LGIARGIRALEQQLGERQSLAQREVHSFSGHFFEWLWHQKRVAEII